MLPSLSSVSSRLRFKQIRLLIAIDELGSLHRAADHLGMTQPAATKALHEIETTFGTVLFVRSPKGIQPNDLGRCVIRYAKVLHLDLSHLHEEMTGVMRGEGGRLSVGAIAGALPAVLVRALAELRKKQPALSIELRVDTSVELLVALREGRLDLAICRSSVAPQPELFDYDQLCEEKVAIAVSRNHPLAKLKRVSLDMLMQYPWICYPSHLPLRTLLEREFSGAGLAFPTYLTETSSMFATILMLQEDSALVALMSAETMEFCVRQKMAHRLPLEIGSRTEPYGIVRRRGWALSPVAGMLVEELKKEAARRMTPV